jgi:mycofactocin system glycosyltransferase
VNSGASGRALPLPTGFRIILDPGTRQLTDHLWFGGSPARVLRLTDAGRAAWQALADGPVDSAATGTLARRLTDAGLAHPVPPPLPQRQAMSLTVVIPVHGRAELLSRCLAGLDGGHPVVVVDDASPDPVAIATVAARHGATLVRREVNGGPAAARNTALACVDTDLVAFLDSDCVPTPGWADRLARHFADPLIAAVAPRVRPIVADTWCGRYASTAGNLDLGTQPVRVVPGSRLAYVPTAALVTRRTALESVASEGLTFDQRLRVGEDVDLGWRLHDARWRVRYEPDVQVDHHEPASWSGLLARRARYGTSAAPLARRRPEAIAPLALQPWPTIAVAALLGRRPLLAAAAFAASVLSIRRILRAHDIPTNGLLQASATSVYQTWLGIGRYGTQFATPVLAALLAMGGRRRTGRRLATLSLLLGPPLAGWLTRRPALDPVRYAVGALADDIAYGTGVWTGCLSEGTTTPLRPIIVRRPLRIDPNDNRGTS